MKEEKQKLISAQHQQITHELNQVKEKILQFKNQLENAPDTAFDTVQEKFKEISLDIMNLVQHAVIQKELAHLLFDFINNPKTWLFTVNDPFFGKNTHLLPALYECACINSDNFDRFKNNRREQIEASILSFVKQRFPDPMNAVINYVSFGSGGLLQDFIIIIKLIQQGYNHINVSLIDSSGKEEDVKLVQFKALSHLEAERGTKVNINFYNSVEKYRSLCSVQPDLIVAIDQDDFYRDAFDETLNIQKCLHEDGQMFLSLFTQDFIFTKNGCLQPVLDLDSVYCSQPMKTCFSSNNNKKHLKITNLVSNDFFDMLSGVLLPYIKHQDHIEEITLTLARPQELNFFGRSLGSKKPNLHVSQEELEHFIRLLLSRPVQIHLNYITGYKNIDKLLFQLENDQDIIFYPRRVNKHGESSAFLEVEKLHHKFTRSDIFFGICAFDRTGDKPVLMFQCEWIWNRENLSPCFIVGDEKSQGLLKKFYGEKNHFKEVLDCNSENLQIFKKEV